MVTTVGGLCRYRLGDRVRVTGHVQRTPSLQFLGRAGNASDLFGEKLSEAFVIEVLHEMFASCNAAPGFSQLAPEEDEAGWRYTLYVECEPHAGWVESLDRALHRNPHYACCRKHGQLQPPKVTKWINRSGVIPFLSNLPPGTHLGASKPAVLCLSPDSSMPARDHER